MLCISLSHAGGIRSFFGSRRSDNASQQKHIESVEAQQELCRMSCEIVHLDYKEKKKINDREFS